MDSVPRVYPVFGIYTGKNESETQFYFDGALNAPGILFLCRPVDLALARSSDSPFEALELGDIVALLDRDTIGIKIRDSDRGQRHLILRLYDSSPHPALPLPAIDLTQPSLTSLSLVEAAKKGDFAGVAKELSMGADSNSVGTDGNSALLYAVAKGQEDVVRTLIAYGADAFRVNFKGMSPLSLAEERIPKLVSLLRKSERQVVTWDWIRRTYQTAKPW